MKQQKVALYTDISGNDIGFQTYTYGTGKPGLYIQGGVHGGETTYYIFHELHQLLTTYEKHLKKQVMLAPMINPAAWNQRVYYYTVGKFDLYKGSDWNRKYPGDATNLSGRISKILFTLASKYDFAIDLHTARHSKPYVIYEDTKLVPQLKALGLPYNIFAEPATKYKGSFHDALTVARHKAVTIESGSHDAYNEKDVQQVTLALQRLLQSLDILDLSIAGEKTKQYSIDSVDTIHSPVSGFAKYLVEPQQKIKAQQPLAEIYSSDALGKTEIIAAPYDGIVFELPRTNIVWTGDELFKIVNKACCKTLS